MKKNWIALGLLLASCSADASPRIGAFRGYAALNLELKARMFGLTSDFTLLEYILGDYDLSLLLGGYVLERENRVFKNDVPNAVNVTLYLSAFRMLAEGLSRACTTGALALETPDGKNIPFDPIFRPVLAPACSTLSSSGPADEAALLALWEALLGYGIAAEASAWVEFVRELESAGTPSELKRTQAFLGILLHPYFLLEK